MILPGVNSQSKAGSNQNVYFVLEALSQSNGAGRAETGRLTSLTPYVANPANVKIYFKPNRTSADNGNWEDLVAGENNIEPEYMPALNCHGAEPILGKMLTDRVSENPIYWCKCSLGGTSLKQGLTAIDWSELTAGELFDIATQYYFDPAYTKLQALHPGKPIKPIILPYQGESDANNSTAASEYVTNLPNWITAYRAYNSILANAPIIFTKLNYYQHADEATVNAAIDSFCAGDSHSWAIDMTGLYRKQDLTTEQKGGITPTTGGDDAHTSYLGQIHRSTQIFNKLIEIGYI